MRRLVLALIGVGLLAGCRATERVAHTSVNIATAPVRLVRNRFHRDDNVSGPQEVYESRPMAPASAPARPAPRERPPGASTANAAPTSAPSAGLTRPPAVPTPVPPSSALAVATTSEFPTAKAVPSKPGFVYSPFDGTMIDVTGFSSGTKAKDPGNNKIFIVP